MTKAPPPSRVRGRFTPNPPFPPPLSDPAATLLPWATR